MKIWMYNHRTLPGLMLERSRARRFGRSSYFVLHFLHRYETNPDLERCAGWFGLVVDAAKFESE